MIKASDLLEVAIAVNSASSAEAILNETLQCVERFMQYDRVTVALYNPDIDMLEISQLKSSISGVASLDKGIRIPVDETNLLGWCFINKKTHRQDQALTQSRFNPVQRSKPVTSHIIAPLLGREKMQGVLTIGSYESHFYNQDNEKVFTAYAHLAGVALENLHLFETAQELSIKDGLTGAYNHRHFQSCLAHEIERSSRYSSPCSLFLIDIDHFKTFNDTYGHPVGDLVLRQTTKIIQEGRRSSDSVYRYGGEEFAVLLPQTDRLGAERVAQQIIHEIREKNIYQHSKSKQVPVRVSIGCATFPDNASSPNAIIAVADQALYSAKSNGRDRYEFFESIDDDPGVREQLRQIAQPDFIPTLNHHAIDGLDEHHHLLVLAEQMARHLSLTPPRRMHLKMAVLLHDIGEWGVPAKIARKKGKLTARERQIVQTHPCISEEIVRKYVEVDEILKTVLYHHENYDGSGYPEGLNSAEIPELARILAVIDTFDALTSDRPYRPKLTIDQAYSELRRVAGYQLDPQYVEEFIVAHQG